MDLYISGSGDVDFSKLYVSIPDYIPKNRKINLTKINFACTDINPFTKTQICHGEPITAIETPTFWNWISPYYYRSPYINGNDEFSGLPISGSAPMIVGEGNILDSKGTSHAPFSINFTVAEDAPPGDHDISITYSYQNKGKWYEDRQNIKVHINRFYETDKFYSIAAAFTILSFIVLMIQIIKDGKKLMDYCNRNEKRKASMNTEDEAKKEG